MRVRYIIGPDASLDINDRGLAYGDGLFETMAIVEGSVRRLALHLERLRLGCDRLRLPFPDAAELTERLAGAAAGIGAGQLKLMLTRGSGPRGYAPPRRPEPVAVLVAAPRRTVPTREISAVSLSATLGENEKLAGIKHLCRLEQVLGQLELQDHEADEGIMLTGSGRVIGGTSRNLFAVLNGRLVTPRISRAGVAGIMRRAVLETCERLGIAAAEAELGTDDLAHASELFMTNALVGIQSVVRLDGRDYGSRVMAVRLRSALGLDADA